MTVEVFSFAASLTPPDMPPTLFRVEVGTRIRAARRFYGKTQREIAELSGINQTDICKLENGKRGLTANELVLVAAAILAPGEATRV